MSARFRLWKMLHTVTRPLRFVNDKLVEKIEVSSMKTRGGRGRSPTTLGSIRDQYPSALFQGLGPRSFHTAAR
jgi:hypothetical protein